MATGSLDPFAPLVRSAGTDRQGICNSAVGRLWMRSEVLLHPFIVVRLPFVVTSCGSFLSGILPVSTLARPSFTLGRGQSLLRLWLL